MGRHGRGEGRDGSRGEQGLEKCALGLCGNVVIGLASTAPACAVKLRAFFRGETLTAETRPGPRTGELPGRQPVGGLRGGIDAALARPGADSVPGTG